MQVLTVFNTVAILAITIILLRPLASRIELRIERTFWEKKPHGLRATLWEQPRWSGSNSGAGRRFNWINPDRLSDSIEGKRQNKDAHSGELVPQGVLATVWEGLRGKS